MNCFIDSQSLKITMKYKGIILLVALSVIACKEIHQTNQEITKKYFEARNSVEFSDVKMLINDSLIVVEGDHMMSYSQESFYEVFKWDSIFQTSYDIVELKEVNDQVLASITLSSIRNSFLKNELMTCKFKLSFNSGKISKIESLDCLGADWNIWGKERDDLVNWISENHPELNGFIYDMTMEGAINYLRAIELYESIENDL